MKCLNHLRKIAAAMGCTIDEESLRLSKTIIVDAPPGYQWTGNPGCAGIYVQAENSCQAWYTAAVSDCIDQMKDGLDLCDAETSEAIGHEKGEDWIAPEGSPSHIDFPKEQV